MIVIDLGCYEHESSFSVRYLVQRFKPAVLYGFDPLLPQDSQVRVKRTPCLLRKAAAWTRDGTLGIEYRGTGTFVYEDEDGEIPCFDLARFIAELPAEEEIVLKLDVEGAEYPLLRHLRDHDLDERLALALVEWHARARIRLRCPVEEWTM